MSHVTIVLSDHCKYMYGRYRRDGQHSGEAFREDVLIPALMEHETVTVDITMKYGLASSSLEEIFGGLVRNTELTSDDVLKRVNVVSDCDALKNSAITYITLAGE